MFNSKEEAKKWICNMLDKHSYSFNKIFPNQKEGEGHFFKIDFNSHSIIIDGEYGRGSEGKFKDLLNNKFRSIIPYKGLKNIKVRRCKDLEPVKSARIIFYFENPELRDKLNETSAWSRFFLPKSIKTEETSIILHEELLNDKDFSEEKLIQVFKLFTTINY